MQEWEIRGVIWNADNERAWCNAQAVAAALGAALALVFLLIPLPLGWALEVIRCLVGLLAFAVFLWSMFYNLRRGDRWAAKLAEARDVMRRRWTIPYSS